LKEERWGGGHEGRTRAKQVKERTENKGDDDDDDVWMSGTAF